jgi:hypothetical protein
MNSLPDTSRLQAWAEVLTQVQQAISQALAALDDRERTLAQTAASPGGSASSLPGVIQGLQGFPERLTGHQGGARRAEECAAEADQALAENENLLRDHLAATASVRQKLAEWAGRA